MRVKLLLVIKDQFDMTDFIATYDKKSYILFFLQVALSLEVLTNCLII